MRSIADDFTFDAVNIPETSQDKVTSLQDHVQAPGVTVTRSVPCTFIFPRRHRRRCKASDSGLIQDRAHGYRAQESLIAQNSILGSPFADSLSPTWMARDSISTSMTRTSGSVSGRSSHTRESSPTETFGSRQSAFHDSILTSPARPSYSTKEGAYLQGPLTAGCISDCSTEQTEILTPGDPLFPQEPSPSPSKPVRYGTSDISEEPRSSVFSITAYQRDDNAATPSVIEPELDFSNPSVDSQHAVNTQSSQIASSTSTPSLHRARRPPPLVIPPLQYHALSAGQSDGYEVPLQSAASSQFSLPRTTTPRKDKSPVSDYVKNLRLELWIDQEEHRTIRPKFAYKRHIPPPTASAVGQRQKDKFWENITSSGLVDMRMTEKESGIFHCGVHTFLPYLSTTHDDDRNSREKQSFGEQSSMDETIKTISRAISYYLLRITEFTQFMAWRTRERGKAVKESSSGNSNMR